MIKNIFTSNWDFSKDEQEERGQFQMVNLAILLSSVGLFFGLSVNHFIGLSSTYQPIEIVLLVMNAILFIALRIQKNTMRVVVYIETIQFTFFFLFLVYVSEPSQLKHVWIFTYPIILLYFQHSKYAFYWVTCMIFFLLIAPLQPFIHVDYSLFQVSYISAVLVIISIIIYFYQVKMDDAKKLILSQQETMQAQIAELLAKDHLLSVQSKQAVMGEMISMIAHQWRQPLSTVTLSISDMQIKSMLGESVSDAKMQAALQKINDTVIYLSDTIDDFQTYFNPNKDINHVSIEELIQKSISFIYPRLKGSNIELEYISDRDEIIQTYSNELIQVLLNLLNNAIDELTAINQEIGSIVMKLQNNEDHFLIKITDNGNGIKADSMGEIFEPYFSTKGKNGTGLGLYMSQMIMEKQFNSKIEVTNKETGAEFSLKVPKVLS